MPRDASLGLGKPIEPIEQQGPDMDRRTFIGATVLAATTVAAQHALAQEAPAPRPGPSPDVVPPNGEFPNRAGGGGNPTALADLEARLSTLEANAITGGVAGAGILGHGTVTSNEPIPGPGFISFGAGLAAESAGTGVIRIRFDPSLADAPIVLATSSGINRIGSPLVNIFITSASAAGFTFESYENGRPASASFNFLILSGRNQ